MPYRVECGLCNGLTHHRGSTIGCLQAVTVSVRCSNAKDDPRTFTQPGNTWQCLRPLLTALAMPQAISDICASLVAGVCVADRRELKNQFQGDSTLCKL